MSGFLGQLLGSGGMLSQFLGTTEGATGGGLTVMISQLIGTAQSGAGGAGGGLKALVTQFESAGLGDQMKSWVGTGQNLPITAEQVSHVMPQTQLTDLATKFGIPADKISALLAEVLPHAVDHATPGGSMPLPGAPPPDLSSLMKRFMSA